MAPAYAHLSVDVQPGDLYLPWLVRLRVAAAKRATTSASLNFNHM